MVRFYSLLKVCLLQLIIALFASSNAIAINRDSLKTVLNTTTAEDEHKANLLLRYANSFVDVNSDSIGVYSRRALALSEKIHYAKGVVIATDIIGTYHFSKGRYDSSLIYHEKALTLNRAGGFDNQMAVTYNNIGNVYMKLSKFHEALSYYDSGLVSGRENDNKLIQGRVLGNIGMICYKVGNYTEALEYHLKGQKIYDEINYLQGNVANYSNLANVYFRLGDYDNALKYADSCKKYAKISGSDWSFVSALTTYALIYNDKKEYRKSLEKLEEGLAIGKQMNSPFLINLLEGNIAECYLNMGALDKSKELYAKTLEVSERLQDIEGVGVSQAGLGSVLLLQNKHRQGIIYLKSALELMQQIRSKEQVKDIARKLSEVYEKIGNYKSSLQYLHIYQLYADSLSRDKVINKDRQIQFNYKLAKKQERIDQLEKNKALELMKSSRQKFFLGALFIGLILTLIIAYLIYRNLKNVQQGKELVTEKKDKIEQQAKKLKELNEFKDRTFSVLSHDLRSPINALTSTMMLFDEKLLTPEEFNEHKLELNNKLQSVSLLLDNLLQWAKSQMKGENTLDIVKLNVKRKVLRSFAILKDTAEHKNVILANTVNDDMVAYGDMNQIGMVIRNLLSNAIKFTPEGGSVTVSAANDGNKVVIEVKDTGVGMSEEQIAKIFKNETNISTLGTNGEKGTGVGLHLSYDFIKNNRGEMIVESKEGMGTTIKVILPNTPNA